VVFVMPRVAHPATQLNVYWLESRPCAAVTMSTDFAFDFTDAEAVGSGTVVVEQDVTGLVAEGLQGLGVVDVVADHDQVLGESVKPLAPSRMLPRRAW